MRMTGVVLTLLLIVVGIAFAALNAKVVPINYLIGSTEVPLALILFISLASGIIISALFMGFNVLRLAARNKILEGKLRRTQEQLTKEQTT